MFTFPTESRLHQLIAEFYEAQKVTAALCHGTCALLFVKLSDGISLIAVKMMTVLQTSKKILSMVMWGKADAISD